MTQQNLDFKLKRTSYVWTLYILLGLFSFMLTMIGPMAPFLKNEFSISYTLAGLHQSAFALGMVLMGLFASVIIKKLGITLSMWGGMLIMLVGLLVMIVSPGISLTLPSVFFMSLGGMLALSAIQTSFITFPHHLRGKVIMEANVLASLCTMSVPLVLLLGPITGLGWRVVFPAMLISVALTASFGLPATIKHQSTRDEKADAGSGKLNVSFWRMWVLVLLGVSVEWSVGFWCMTYLLGLPGNSQSVAATGVVVLGFSSVMGRFVSSRLSGKLSDTIQILLMMLLVLVGFPLYWLRSHVILTYLGLVFCGFGSAVFYPLGLSLAFKHAPNNGAKAGSLTPIASGTAIGLAPFLLGSLADSFSLELALWYIPVGILLMFILIAYDAKVSKRA